jgi:hypothetical protein
MIFSGNKCDRNNAYFNASLTKYCNLNSYIDLFKTTIHLKSMSTKTDIEPDVLGGNVEDTLVKYGKPDFIFEKNKLMIYLYSRKLNDLKIRYEIHFCNAKVFSVHYIYQRVANADKEYLVTKLKDKYLRQDFKDAKICLIKIIDRNNNTVFMNEFLGGLRITYLSNKKLDWFAEMTAQIKTKEVSGKTVTEKDVRSFCA